MINIIVGGIGSGKSITAVKEIMIRKNNCFVNFDIKFKGAERLKLSDIIIEKEKNEGNRIRMVRDVNWDFWNTRKKTGFDIYIDEAHNVLNARMAMTKQNILFNKWIAQIRKILGESEQYNLTFITQRMTAIDIAARELSTHIIHCRKIKSGESVYIINTHFLGSFAYDKFVNYCEGSEYNDGKTCFYANPLFKYFPSHELVTFGDEVYI